MGITITLGPVQDGLDKIHILKAIHLGKTNAVIIIRNKSITDFIVFRNIHFKLLQAWLFLTADPLFHFGKTIRQSGFSDRAVSNRNNFV
ncbi:hypothetical protein D3C72_1787620 [compost metagenome]